MIPENMGALQTRVSAVLRDRPECFVTHPSELALLAKLTTDELHEFALDHGWRVVRRLGGRQIEFYNDVGARLAREG